jgi:Spy/CpxP family protein refolding chaperone
MSLKQKFVSAITLGFALLTLTIFASAQEKTTTTDTTAAPEKVERREPGRFKGEGRGPGMRGEGRHGGPGGPRGILRGLHSVDLTEAQRTQIKGIMDSKRESFRQVHEQMRDLGRAKHDGTMTPEQETQFKTLRDQIKANADATRQEVLNVLTTEQRTKLEQFEQEMKQRREERRQRGPRPGRGEGPPPPTDKPADN